MSDDVILSLDLGTLSVRSMLFGLNGDQRFVASLPLELIHVDEQHVEQDSDAMLSGIQTVMRQAVSAARDADWTIVSAGLAVQRSSVVAWDRASQRPLSPVLSWQDRRGTAWLSQTALDRQEIRRRTGLPVSPHYGATKLAWLEQQLQDAHEQTRNPGVTSSELVIGPLAAWVVAALTDTPMPWVDFTNAARTQLVALGSPCEWDPWLLQQFGVSLSLLPEIKACRGELGTLRTNGVPFRAVCGDQYAAFYSDGVETTGRVIANLGTGGFVMTEAAHGAALQAVRFLESPGPWGRNLWEGTVNGVGAAMAWAARQLDVNRSDATTWQAGFDEKSTDLVFLNRVGGLGSPWWDPSGESMWIDSSGRPVDLPEPKAAMQAVLESIAFLLASNVEEIRQAGATVDRLVVAGGLSQSSYLVQALADLIVIPVQRTSTVDATARGIAMLASPQVERWEPAPLDAQFAPVFRPNLQQRYQRFRRAIDERSGQR